MSKAGALLSVLISFAPFEILAFGDDVPFTAGVPVEERREGHFQNGQEVDDDSLEGFLGTEATPALEDMRSALKLRTGGRVCLGIGLPLLIGGVVTSIVASSGTVGSGTGTMAVYGVSIGLLTVSIGLDVAALVLYLRSGRRYDDAIEKYNASLVRGSSARLRLYLAGSGARLAIEF